MQISRTRRVTSGSNKVFIGENFVAMKPFAVNKLNIHICAYKRIIIYYLKIKCDKFLCFNIISNLYFVACM